VSVLSKCPTFCVDFFPAERKTADVSGVVRLEEDEDRLPRRRDDGFRCIWLAELPQLARVSVGTIVQCHAVKTTGRVLFYR